MKKILSKIQTWAKEIYPQKDKLWLIIWFTTIAALGLWNFFFLNRPALKQVTNGFLNTSGVAIFVVMISLLLGWLVTLILVRLESNKFHFPYYVVTFLLNIIRSIPQIVGILFGYIWITYLISKDTLSGSWIVITCIAFIMSVFIFLEIVDLMRERIEHFKKVDFYNAMKVCGISENRIINFDILWKNSRVHILNKLIAIFGIAIFLQCSVDFIISVGLSTDISAVNLPTTLGSLLAKIDSKQDILAIGNTFTNPGYISNIFFEHLQGLTVAFLIVFTLLSIYKISNGYAERHRL